MGVRMLWYQVIQQYGKHEILGLKYVSGNDLLCLFYYYDQECLAKWRTVYVIIFKCGRFCKFFVGRITGTLLLKPNEYERIMEHHGLQYCIIKCRYLKVCKAYLYLSYCDLSYP